MHVLNKKTLGRGNLPPTVIDISRHGNLRFPGDLRPTLGNPFIMTSDGGRDGTRVDVVRSFSVAFTRKLARPGFQEWLRTVSEGKTGVACYCAPALCHGHPVMAAILAIRDGRDPIAAVEPFTRDPDLARSALDHSASPVS